MSYLIVDGRWIVNADGKYVVGTAQDYQDCCCGCPYYVKYAIWERQVAAYVPEANRIDPAANYSFEECVDEANKISEAHWIIDPYYDPTALADDVPLYWETGDLFSTGSGGRHTVTSCEELFAALVEYQWTYLSESYFSDSYFDTYPDILPESEWVGFRYYGEGSDPDREVSKAEAAYNYSRSPSTLFPITGTGMYTRLYTRTSWPWEAYMQGWMYGLSQGVIPLGVGKTVYTHIKASQYSIGQAFDLQGWDLVRDKYKLNNSVHFDYDQPVIVPLISGPVEPTNWDILGVRGFWARFMGAVNWEFVY